MLVLSGCFAIFGQPYQNFLPALAKDTLGIGAGALGFLYAAGGVGATIGVLAVATLGDVRRKGSILLTMVCLFGLMILCVSLSRALPLTWGPETRWDVVEER